MSLAAAVLIDPLRRGDGATLLYALILLALAGIRLGGPGGGRRGF
jgi:hypothetical protein